VKESTLGVSKSQALKEAQLRRALDDVSLVRSFIQSIKEVYIMKNVQPKAATQIAEPPIARFFAYLITFGEILVGLGLILGVLTGITAFF
jgi:uncharacterized membrane protein YphA (DoxX/SURF4 family)